MRKRKLDLDRITTLLTQCLGRIGEHAYLVQQLDGEVTDSTASVLFESEDAALQGLMDSLIESSAAADRADLNHVVQQTVQSFLGETKIPVVVRERLAPDLAMIHCRPGKLACAVRRALVIALGHMVDGCEIVVTTRADSDSVVLEVEGHGTGRERHAQERSSTLCDFVADLRGECRIDSDQFGSLRIELELPRSLPC